MTWGRGFELLIVLARPFRSELILATFCIY